MIKYAILVLLFTPLLTAMVNRFCYRVSGAVHIIAIAGLAVSFALSAYLFTLTMGMGMGSVAGQTYLFHYYTLVAFPTFTLNFSVYVDQLTTVMLLVVTFVSLMVHIYSVGYMSSYKGFARFFSYISFFTFAMMLLVLAENFLVLFIGWELVGFSSYLLIGFFRDRYKAGLAATKAFLINRLADLGLYTAIILLVAFTGSLSFSDTVLNSSALEKLASMPLAGLPISYLDFIAFLILLSAVGKSAQFPLHTWLLDAMEGPAPISALIHAATMVTAGVYIIARAYPMFMLSDTVSMVIVALAVATAFIGATSALFCRDIKRILAFSTMSQLGYMFMALGTGYYSIAIFHLFTHAFFKALLFLSAGSVAKALHDQLDITKMGGLMKRMPVTGATFFVGALAIAGIPPLAGFFSKDLIVISMFTGAPTLFAWLSVATAFLTALYMFRLFFMVFYGKPRDEKLYAMAEEKSQTMRLVLVVLAFFSTIVGVLGYSSTSGFFFIRMLQNVFPIHHDLHHSGDGVAFFAGTAWIAPMSIVIVVLGLLLAAYLYRGDLQRVTAMRVKFARATGLFSKEWYVDAVINRVIVPLFTYVALIFRSIDAGVRGFSIFASITTRFFGFLSGSLQGRTVSTYAFWFVLGNLILLLFVIFGS